MILSYRTCSSIKCHTIEGESCPFKYKKQSCEYKGAYHVYETINKQLDRDVTQRENFYEKKTVEYSIINRNHL